MNTLADQIAAIVAAGDFGTASANKRGRNPNWPYVPIVMHGQRSEQIVAKAFATRPEAIAYAQAVIDARRDILAQKLADPRYRALREQHGLPRELD